MVHLRASKAGGLFLAALVAASLPGSPAAARNDDRAIAAAISFRTAFGLEHSPEFVRSLAGSSRDVGTAAYGVPLTAAELEAIDLPGRSEKAQRADKKIRPLARRMSGYAGMYQDQKHGGRIVVKFTHISNAQRAALKKAAADVEMAIQADAAYTYGDLDRAVNDALAGRDVLVRGASILGAGIDEAANQVDIGVDTTRVASATQKLADLEAALGVRVRIVEAEPSVEQVCDATGRTTCYDPMKAGTLVHNALWDNALCTMGFHVQLKSNTAMKGFLTSGHCSYPSGSTNWYMEGWSGPATNGFIGAVQANRFKDLGEDCMVVAMPANQASRAIYDTSRTVVGSGNPVQGETIYNSAGKKDEDTNAGILTATVSYATWSYVSSSTGYVIHAADASAYNLATVLGDSGSPIFRRSGTSGAVAIGVHSTAQGYFARMGDCLSNMGYSVN